MIDGSKKGTSILCQEVVKKDRGGKKLFAGRCCSKTKMFAEVHTKKKFAVENFHNPSRKIMVRP